ncbi:fibrobacter succinogenes major paralogous domain-containing protein [bacterium]|nr:fibrobacter succinogenes major paralogous domain-containing protein [bacterium]
MKLLPKLFLLSLGTGFLHTQDFTPTHLFEHEYSGLKTSTETVKIITSSTLNKESENKFKTIQIGNQVWSASNLRVDHYRNGDPIPQVQDPAEWCKINYGAWCHYENDTQKGRAYGKLYNWYAVNDPRGLAPSGWHVPSDREWQTLVDYVGGSQTGGNELKWQYGWKDNGNGNDGSGFSAIPSGYRTANDGSFGNLGSYALFWTATESSRDEAYERTLGYGNAKVYRNSGNSKRSGFSVRLVRD